MTCVVAMQTADIAVMAADRQIVDGWIRHDAGAPKVVERDGWLLGTTGPIRVNNAVKHRFAPPPIPDIADESWIVTTFVPALMEQMVATKSAVIEGWLGGKESEQQGTVMVARPGVIFTVQADWAVDVWREPYAAIGTGQRYALAACFASLRSMPATLGDYLVIAQTAVRAAGQFDVYCGGEADAIAVTKGNGR